MQRYEAESPNTSKSSPTMQRNPEGYEGIIPAYIQSSSAKSTAQCFLLQPTSGRVDVLTVVQDQPLRWSSTSEPGRVGVASGLRRRNINNSSNRLQQPSALHNQQQQQANFIKHALHSSVPHPPLAYEITDLTGKATNKVSERQQQRRKALECVANRMAHLNACQPGFADLEASVENFTSPNEQPSQQAQTQLAHIIQQTRTHRHQSSNPSTTTQYVLAQQQQTQQAAQMHQQWQT
uniref:Uncharacterized protein n=1 Tax=Glossina austeni TaxID=7395 RepID=A0A1A9VTJ9_GLOAU